jgi:hypothetical protein
MLLGFKPDEHERISVRSSTHDGVACSVILIKGDEVNESREGRPHLYTGRNR